jgi:hypothetical protein
MVQLVRMRPHGLLGAHLFDMVGSRVDAWSQGLRMGETYTFGDSPVVLLTALDDDTFVTGTHATTPTTNQLRGARCHLEPLPSARARG